jgi:hypothetical protein
MGLGVMQLDSFGRVGSRITLQEKEERKGVSFGMLLLLRICQRTV